MGTTGRTYTNLVTLINRWRVKEGGMSVAQRLIKHQTYTWVMDIPSTQAVLDDLVAGFYVNMVLYGVGLLEKVTLFE